MLGNILGTGSAAMNNIGWNRGPPGPLYGVLTFRMEPNVWKQDLAIAEGHEVQRNNHSEVKEISKSLS